MSSQGRFLNPWGGLGLFLVVLGGLAVPLWLGPIAAHRPAAQCALALSGAAWAAVVWLSLGGVSGLSPRAQSAWILLGALLLRAVVGLGDPQLSDDVHRYVWEGGLVAEGVSPYAWAPNDPHLEDYRERWSGVYSRMNHTSVSAAYPPLSQALFAGLTTLSGGPQARDGKAAVAAMRWAFGGLDLLVLVLLLWRFRGAPARALVWGWSPLVSLEFAGSAHFDSLGICLMLAALLCLERGRKLPLVGYLLLALGVLVKLLPLALFPCSTQARGKLWKGALLVLSVLCLGVLPILWLEGGLSGIGAGLSQYAQRWESFSLLFRALEWPLERCFGDPLDPSHAGRLARLGVLMLLALLALWQWQRRVALIPGSFWMIAGFLLLTPTLHPWYLTWLIPFLAFRPSTAWTGLLVLAPLLYWPLTEWQARAEWIEPGWLWPAICLPFLALLIIETWGRGSRDFGHVTKTE